MQNSAVHILIDNKVTLSYLLKIEDMEGICSQQLFSICYLLTTYYLRFHQIMITAEYLLSKLSVKAD